MFMLMFIELEGTPSIGEHPRRERILSRLGCSPIEGVPSNSINISINISLKNYK